MAEKPTQRVTEVVVLTTAMLTFISLWRAAAIVLCDMASTAWYIGGIAERAIGRAAPWFIMAVMAFSACMLAVYVEASTLFVRGGVYKVVKESMGGMLAKIAVSAMIFAYVFTGPISAVSAGTYVAGLLNELFPILRIGWEVKPALFSTVFAVLVTLYFWRQNIRGIEESSDKAIKIMQLVTVMGVVMFAFSVYTLWVRGFTWPPLSISFGEDSLGWLEGIDWPRSVTAAALVIGLGHAFLGMSGLETLAQVFRELEAPKILNLKKTAVIVFFFAFAMTVSMTFFAVTIIPDDVRTVQYADNLLSGLAMNLAVPHALKILLQIFVVLTGAFILAGAVNTSILGVNGVLCRVAEDGIMPDWFRWLHPRFGTTYRIINLIVALQIATILLCRGDVYLLGESYAFGIVWSFVFITIAMIVLRYKVKGREWRVPLNIDAGRLHIPVGLLLILGLLIAVAFSNLFTKKIATIAGGVFTLGFFLLFQLSEYLNSGRKREDEPREMLNLRKVKDISDVSSDLGGIRRTLVAIGISARMNQLKKVLEGLEEDSEVVVLHCRMERRGMVGGTVKMGPNEELLFTRVIATAEKFGHHVTPLLVVSNDPAYAVAQAAQAVGASEVVMGASHLGVEDQLERLAMTWGAIQKAGTGKPIRFRVIADGKEMIADL